MELADVTDSKSVGLITRVGSSPTTGTRTQWLANPVISRVCGLSFLPYALDFSPCASANSDCFWHGPPVLRQIWRSISVMDHRRIYPHNRVGRRHFGIEIQMSIDIRGRRNIAVAQPFLDFFQADSVCIQQTRAAMTEIVKTDFSQAILLQNQRKVLCDITRLHKFANFVDIDISFGFGVVGLAAELSVLLLLEF